MSTPPARFEPVTGVTVAAPVGAAVTDTGWTFTVEPVDPYAQPFRLRCAHCPWQATATGAPVIASLIRRHAIAHDLDTARTAPGEPVGIGELVGPVWRRLRARTARREVKL
jgi:hypothetical protein